MSEYNLKAVLRMTGLTAETVRAWERRYGVVRPERSENGRRTYSSVEVERLRRLALLARRGFRIGELASLNDVELLRRIESSQDDAAAGAMTRSHGAAELMEALDRFDLDELRKRLTEVRFLLSPREFALELVPSLMYRVGELIVEQRIEIAQEHALSHLVRNELRLVYDALEPLDGAGRAKRRMLFGTREGDYHEIGLMLAAILCRSQGTRCQYLGPNLPAGSIASAVRMLKPHAVVLGLSWLPPEEERVTTQQFLAELDRDLPATTELWIGGSAASGLGRSRTLRTFWIFESLHDLEAKLKL